MKKHLSLLLALSAPLLGQAAAQTGAAQAGAAQTGAGQTITLTPARTLTLAQIEQVARGGARVAIDNAGWKNIEAGHEVVMRAALNNMAVYGLTVGVGWNKDRPVFKEVNGQKIIDSELLNMSHKFNKSSLRAHSAGLGEPLPADVVRAGMLIRLNTFLNGEAGVQKAVAQEYLDYLNNGITPVVPSRGTVGEADITQAAHIGLAMIGEWDVIYKGKRQSARSVMAGLKLQPLDPVGKDFLSILSTNSLTAGRASLAVQDTRAFYNKQIKLFALMLEGYNGNVAPYTAVTTEARPFKGMVKATSAIRQTLHGSDLWKTSDTRALQDALSFRTFGYSLGQLSDALDDAEAALNIQNNHTDDNPLVLITAPQTSDPQLQRYNVVGGGAIYPTANFNFLPVAGRMEELNNALARVAESMTQQLIRLENPDFTHLSRFLAGPDNEGHAFGAIQKPFMETDIRIKELAAPLSASTVVLAGNIEDTATMSGLTVQNTEEILNGMYEIAAFQLLHGTQALELRKGFTPSASTSQILTGYRKLVPFVAQDTPYTDIIQKGMRFWKNYR